MEIVSWVRFGAKGSQALVVVPVFPFGWKYVCGIKNSLLLKEFFIVPKIILYRRGSCLPDSDMNNGIQFINLMFVLQVDGVERT